jgi:hypothetical protein
MVFVAGTRSTAIHSLKEPEEWGHGEKKSAPMPPVYIGVPIKHYRYLEIETKAAARLKLNRKRLSCPQCGSNRFEAKASIDAAPSIYRCMEGRVT